MVHVEPIKDDGRPVTLGTGGTSGIGQATARMLAVRGWHVISVGLDTEESIPETQRLGRGELFTYEMDVTKPADIMCILNALPRLDAIVHCAGFGIAGSAECTPMTLARKQFDVNYFGVLQVNELALRLEGRRHGITATIIEPGDLSTGFTGSRILAEPANSPYYDECQRSVGQIAHDEQTGAGPESAVRVIAATLGKRNPPVCIAVGGSYKVLMQLKRVLPDRIVEFVMRRIYMKP